VYKRNRRKRAKWSRATGLKWYQQGDGEDHYVCIGGNVLENDRLKKWKKEGGVGVNPANWTLSRNQGGPLLLRKICNREIVNVWGEGVGDNEIGV